MNYKSVIFLGIVALSGFQAQANAASVNLGTAENFAVLAGSAVTNVGASMFTGNVGVSPGTAITGVTPGMVTGTIEPGTAVAAQAQNDNLAAYNSILVLPTVPANNLSGQDLGGLTLAPGVYDFDVAANLTGTLTLNNLGDPNALFVFRIGSTLITGSNSAVIFSDLNNESSQVFFQVGSSATIGANTRFRGSILALTAITFGTDARINCGRALAQNAAVTLINNTITTECLASPQAVPEPDSSFGLVGFGLVGLLLSLKKRSLSQNRC